MFYKAALAFCYSADFAGHGLQLCQSPGQHDDRKPGNGADVWCGYRQPVHQSVHYVHLRRCSRCQHFAAQYIGNNDNKMRSMPFASTSSWSPAFGAFIAVMYLFQDKLISAFLHISSGGRPSGYPAIRKGISENHALAGAALCPGHNLCNDPLRLGKDSMTPMKASFAALFTNLIFNHLLIFGKLGFPRLGEPVQQLQR